MKLFLSSKKPKVNIELPALCSFRSSKGYLWALIRERLSTIQQSSQRPLHILDAACHALITRNMFPPTSLYYGLDMSSYRLNQSEALRRQDDVLYRADLTRPLGLDGAFDVVVSCNTMSHLPSSQQISALGNLCQSLKRGGSLFVNYSLDQGVMAAAQSLLIDFERVQPIYFDSFLSSFDESNASINQNNISTKIISNELSLPNDACLHRQILFHAHNKLSSIDCVGSAPRSCTIQTLNTLPNVQVLSFKSDREAIEKSKQLSQKVSFLLTPDLYESPYGRKFFDINNIPSQCLRDSLEINQLEDNICIFGLENNWCSDMAAVRVALNRLRDTPGLNIYLLIVSSRNDVKCEASLIVRDY